MKRAFLSAFAALLAACASTAHPARIPALRGSAESASPLGRDPMPMSGVDVIARFRVPDADVQPQAGYTLDVASHLVRAFRTFLAPGSWEHPRRALYRDGDDLVMVHDRNVLDLAPVLLSILKTHRNRLMRVETRILSPDPMRFKDLGNLRPRKGALTGIFNRTDLDRLLDSWRGTGAADFSAPRLTLFQGQVGWMSVLDQLAYVAGYTPRPNSVAWVWDYDVDVVSKGVRLEASAIQFDALSRIWSVHVDIRQSGLLDAPPAVHVIRFGGHPGSVEVPRLVENRWSDLVTIRADQALLIVLPDLSGRNPERPYLAVRVAVGSVE